MLIINVTMTMTSQIHQSSPELGGLSPLVSIVGGVTFVVVEVESVVDEVVRDDVVLDVVVRDDVVLDAVVTELVVVVVVDVVGHWPTAVRFWS